MKIHTIESWKPARIYPESYPGECPDHSFLFFDDFVFPIDFQPKEGYRVFEEISRPRNLNEFLTGFNLPVLEDRFPVIAYGANRNPATMAIKLKNYNYFNSGQKKAIPMLKGTLKNADVIASGLHGQGYFYGDLLINSPFVKDCQIEVWISFLDQDQLRVMNDSEGIKNKLYSLAWLDSVCLSNTQEELKSLVYISNAPMLIMEETPTAFSQINATNRIIPAMSALEILDFFLETNNLEKEVSKITGIPIDAQMPDQLMKYLNGQWWYHFQSQKDPLIGFDKLLNLFGKIIRGNSVISTTKTYLEELNQLISLEKAYSLDTNFTFKEMKNK